MYTVIGLEVHAQLKTNTKLFCGCSADYFQKEPNSQVCPVCLGMPGALPVLNQKAVEYTMRVGFALNCTIPDRCKFDRKNYFYPDLPKGYQISQFDEPLCTSGYLDYELDGKTHRVRINRVHLEEDAGKLIHAPNGTSQVDLNRACVPLMEIVTEPDIKSPEQAAAFMKALRQLLRYLEICDGDLEKGSMRCDANISMHPEPDQLGTKTEVKNINSFRAVEDALRFEQARHRKILESGQKIIQETLGWDADKGIAIPQRAKEESDDYRYFPDPDLLPVHVNDEWRDEVRSQMPATPAQWRERFSKDYGLPDYDIGVLTEEKETAVYFDQVTEKFNKPKEVSNWMMGEIMRLLKDHEEIKISASDFADLLQVIDEGQINRNTGKEVIESAFETGKSPLTIIEEQGLKQISNTDELAQVIDDLLADNADQVERYRSGKTGLMGWFVGQVMAKTQGKANPKAVNELLENRLNQ